MNYGMAVKHLGKCGTKRMKIQATPVNGVYVIDIEPIGDGRGFFARTFCSKEFTDAGINMPIVQQNMSLSKVKGTLRGLHYQHAPHGEDKYVHCKSGSIFDVAVDINPKSPTYLKWFGIELSAENRTALFISNNCAHGYQVLSDCAEVGYSSSEFYHPESEGGLRYDDPMIGIEWPAEITEISEKDTSWPYLKSSA